MFQKNSVLLPKWHMCFEAYTGIHYRFLQNLLFSYRTKLDCKALNVKLGYSQFAPEQANFRGVQKPHALLTAVETLVALFF